MHGAIVGQKGADGLTVGQPILGIVGDAQQDREAAGAEATCGFLPSANVALEWCTTRSFHRDQLLQHTHMVIDEDHTRCSVAL